VQLSDLPYNPFNTSLFGPGVGTAANPAPVTVQLAAALLATGTPLQYTVQVEEVNALGSSVRANLTRTLSSFGVLSFVVNSTSLPESAAGPPVLLSIGETAQYLLTVQFPRGSTPGANVTITLAPNGAAGAGVLELLSASIVSVGSQLSSSTAGALAVGVSAASIDRQLADGLADTAVFTLGNVLSSAAASQDGQINGTVQVVFAVQVRAPAVAANIAGASVPVSAQFDYSGADASSGAAQSGSIAGSVVEPALAVSVSAPATVQAGQTVHLTTTITQLPTSSAAA
jgi:hypothetical protein